MLRAPLGADLRPLSALLWQEHIAHRIAEESGEQVVRLAADEDRPRAEALLDRWRRGELKVTLRARPRPAATVGLPVALAAAPVTAALIGLSIAGFLLIYLGAPVRWIATLTFNPFTLVSGQPVFTPQQGELWRLVTPVFLHFGWLHIVFNSLWCWELGRRIELQLGRANLVGLFLVIAGVSNLAQHQVTGPVLFGGLSGVVYGWLGFAWVAGQLHRDWRPMAPATPVLLFMVGWLLFCIVGPIEILGFSVANAAHVGGLVAGATLGGLFALVHRSRG